MGQSEDAIDDVIDDLEMSSIGSSSVSHSSKSFPSRQVSPDETGNNPSTSTNEDDISGESDQEGELFVPFEGQIRQARPLSFHYGILGILRPPGIRTSGRTRGLGV